LEKLTIDVHLFNRKPIKLTLFSESLGNTLFKNDDAKQNCEAEYQIREGCSYEFRINDNNYHLEPTEIVSRSKANNSIGRICPNTYVGTLRLNITDRNNNVCGHTDLEVQSVKTTYRQDYRQMLGDIAEWSSELLLSHSSPVSQPLEKIFTGDAETVYQRFSFLKALLDNDDFSEYVHRIVTSPVTRWMETESVKDIRSVRRFRGAEIRQVAGSPDRLKLPDAHPLSGNMNSVPSRITVKQKTETADTPENRFIKHSLSTFMNLCTIIKLNDKVSNERLKSEASALEEKLSRFLSHSLFREISDPVSLPLNSPVLQRKEGYREVLRIWLMLDLAARLCWNGGEDVFGANKKDVAVLYEYWVFFKLLEIVSVVFGLNPDSADKLISETEDGIGLQLKQGKHLAIKGVCETESRSLNVEFSFNRNFSGKSKYPAGGSWTKNMRPDYTFSIWPKDISENEAEIQELIVHVHFDAKYKVNNFPEMFGSDDDEGKDEMIAGSYKRVDLLKMHAYKDAIRRTGGAYVIYPGSVDYCVPGFHEIIPGLGAFVLRPSAADDGSAGLRKFLKEILEHFMNRASQREKFMYKTYDTFGNGDEPDSLKDKIPETIGENRGLIPDETTVLVGYVKSEEHLKWILEEKKYNVRTGDARGSVKVTGSEADAKYLLLFQKNDATSGKLYKIQSGGPDFYSKKDLKELKYPKPSSDYYLVFNIECNAESEFINKTWDMKSLSESHGVKARGFPYAVTLTQLMKHLVRD